MDYKTSNLIEKIYDTVAHASLWREVLDEISSHMGVEGSNIFCSDEFNLELNKTWTSSLTNRMLPSYLADGHVEIENTIFRHIPHVLHEQGLVNEYDLLDRISALRGVDVDISETRRWLESEYGIACRYISPLNFRPGYWDLIAFHSKRKGLDKNGSLDYTKQVILPHIAKASHLNRPFEILNDRFNSIMAALDRFKLGLFIVDKDQNIVINNMASEELLDSTKIISAVKRKLKFKRDIDGNAISKSIEQLSQDASATKLISINNNKTKDSYICHCSRLNMEPHGEKNKRFLIVIVDPNRSDIVDISGLSVTHSLTDREHHVTQGVVDGFSNQEIAESLGIAFETVKAHVKSIMYKTSVKNRVGLVNLAHEVNIPIENPEK